MRLKTLRMTHCISKNVFNSKVKYSNNAQNFTAIVHQE